MTREFRRYRSDDRDLEGHDLEIVVLPPDGNGDWYVGVWPHGARGGPAVRVTTSGTPSGQHLVCVAVAKLYRAMGGESIQDEAGDDLAAFLRLRDGEGENEEVASLRTDVSRLTRQLAVETTRANLWEGVAKRLGAGSQ